MSTYTLTLIGKILCYAIVAVALDLVWGYAGLLSLGHGLFFALGGYAMGMYLMRQAARRRSASVYVVSLVDGTTLVLGRNSVFCSGRCAW
ncbi:MAG: hypothetical protein QM805_27510 [Pseudomonas sp.]